MKHAVSEKTLANGINILYIDVPGTETFDVSIAFNAGYRRATKDDASMYEVPHLLEHMAFDGSKKFRTGDELQDIFTAGGGGWNGMTTPYFVTYVFHNRLRNAARLLEAAVDMAFYPQLTEASFKEELSVIENELRSSMNDFALNADQYTQQQILPELLVSTDMQLGRLGNVTYDAVKKFHRTYFVPANATMLIATDLSKLKKSTIEKDIMQYTDGLKRGKRYPFPTFKVGTAQPARAAAVPLNKHIEETVISVSFAKKGRMTRQQSVAMRMFATLATNMKSYSATYRLRKMGLVYGLDFSFSESVESYGFDFLLSMSLNKVNEVYAYAISMIRDLARQGVTKQQFENAKQDLIDSFEDYQSSVGELIDWYWPAYMTEGTLLTVEDYKSYAKELTQEDVLQTARDILQYDFMYQTVFSAKPYRAATTIELLGREIIQNNMIVDARSIELHSLPVGSSDKGYIVGFYALLCSVIALCTAPLLLNNYGGIAGYLVDGLDVVWNVVGAVFLVALLAIPRLLMGDTLRITIAQLFGVLAAWVVIIIVFDTGSFMKFLDGQPSFWQYHTWVVLGLIATTTVYVLGMATGPLKRAIQARGKK